MAFLTEGAHYTEIEQYPIIEEWMIPDSVDEMMDVVPFDHLRDVKDIENWYVCPYCCDEKLLNVYRNIRRQIKRLRRSKGVLGFDYETGEFVIVRSNGTVVTYYIPDDGDSYWGDVRKQHGY